MIKDALDKKYTTAQILEDFRAFEKCALELSSPHPAARYKMKYSQYFDCALEGTETLRALTERWLEFTRENLTFVFDIDPATQSDFTIYLLHGFEEAAKFHGTYDEDKEDYKNFSFRALPPDVTAVILVSKSGEIEAIYSPPIHLADMGTVH